MSPTEKELRAFLREGEGDVPDAVSVISNAMRVRAAHRKRITTVLTGAAAAVIVVGGSVLLVNAGGSNDESASGGGMAYTTSGGNASSPSAASGETNFGKHDRMQSKSSVVAPGANGSDGYNAMLGLPMCPATPTHYALPGGGGLNAFGANGKMWQRSPNAMRICVYVGKAQPVSRLAYGDGAAALARPIESASVTAAPTSCASGPRRSSGTIEIYALGANGRKLKPVVIDVTGCGPVHATNGTALRYLTKLPNELAGAFAKAEKHASTHR